MEGFTITTADAGENRVVVALTGELDLATADTLWAELEGRIAQNKVVVLDCSRLTFMDSSGLRVLLLAIRKAETVGGRFAVAAIGADVKRAITLSGMSDHVPQHPDVAAALADTSPAGH